MHDLKRLTDWLIAQGIDTVAHTNKSYLAHLIGVYRDLETWGCGEDLCRAGMFHSIYGTQLFQGFKLPQSSRPEVRQLIGERAERLGFINCLMERTSFDNQLQNDAESYTLRNRETDEEIHLNRPDFDDLCRLHLCDWLEQVGRSERWEYRRTAYRQMAERLGGVALEAYDRVYGERGALAPRGNCS